MLLSGCDGQDAAGARKQAKKALERGDFAPVIVAVEPDGANVKVEPLGESFASPLTVWLPFGKHRFAATAPGYEPFETELELTDRARVALPLRLRKLRGATGATIDLTEPDDGRVGGVVTVQDPKPQDHASLLPDRFLNAPDPELEAAAGDSSNGWAWLSLGAGIAAGAGGGVIHAAGDSDASVKGAIGLYAVGAIATGIAVYLFAR